MTYFKDMSAGRQSRKGRAEARKSRKPKATKEQIDKLLDDLSKKNPSHLIGVLREDAAKILGIGVSTLKQTSMHNPRKQI